jgi:hypothetical protein
LLPIRFGDSNNAPLLLLPLIQAERSQVTRNFVVENASQKWATTEPPRSCSALAAPRAPSSSRGLLFILAVILVFVVTLASSDPANDDEKRVPLDFEGVGNNEE